MLIQIKLKKIKLNTENVMPMIRFKRLSKNNTLSTENFY